MPFFDPLNSEYKTQLFTSIGKSLYLNSELADVHFVFESNGECERIPAHKAHLMAGSDVFATMFNGSWKENKEVKIGDTSAAAFKEFLKFFYFGQVKLTMENVAAVMNLGEMYNVTECLVVCTQFLINNLNDDNVCRHYGLAILYNQKSLKKACETFIGINTKSVFQSTDFLSCDQKTLAQILKLDWMSCTEIELFEACMNWVRSLSKRDVVTKKVVLARLRDSFYDIRFGSMSFEQFATLIPTYGQVFVGDDYAAIIQMITDTEFIPNKFSGNRKQRCDSDLWDKRPVIICDRLLSLFDSNQPSFVTSSEKTTFSTNKPLLLESFKLDNIKVYRSGEYIQCEDVPTKITIVQISEPDFDSNYDSNSNSDTDSDTDSATDSESDSDRSSSSEESQEVGENELVLCNMKTKFKSSRCKVMKLPKPILIRPGFLYEIRLKLNPPRHCATGALLKSTVRMKHGIKIQFHDDPDIPEDFAASGLISELAFCLITE